MRMTLDYVIQNINRDGYKPPPTAREKNGPGSSPQRIAVDKNQT